MILISAIAARGRRTSSSIVWPRLLWCRSTKFAGHRSHKCSADSTSSPHNQQTSISEIPTKCCRRQRPGWWPLRRRAMSMSVCSVLAMDVLICSSGRDVYTSFIRQCRMGGGRQGRQMRHLRVAGSSALSGWVSAAPSLAWWSADWLPVTWPQWPGLILTWRVLQLDDRWVVVCLCTPSLSADPICLSVKCGVLVCLPVCVSVCSHLIEWVTCVVCQVICYVWIWYHVWPTLSVDRYVTDQQCVCVSTNLRIVCICVDTS